nr:hypothetical protein [Escherichia coli]
MENGVFFLLAEASGDEVRRQENCFPTDTGSSIFTVSTCDNTCFSDKEGKREFFTIMMGVSSPDISHKTSTMFYNISYFSINIISSLRK